jgi:hypothetical protein
MAIPRVFEHSLSAECEWCHGTGVGTDESGRCYYPGCGSSGRVEYSEWRPSPPEDDRAFFSALGDVMDRAEALGLQAHRALVPWGAKPCLRTNWKTLSYEVQAIFIPYDGWRAASALDHVLPGRGPPPRGMLPYLQRQASAFRAAAAQQLIVPAKVGELAFGPGVAGRSFAQLEDPFAPMLVIHDLGVVLTEVSEQLRFWCPASRSA